MLKEWEKFAGWKVIRYFLEQPTQEIHIRELARQLKISPRSVQIYCNKYLEEGALSCEKKANARMFMLQNDNAAVRALKRFYWIARLGGMKFVEKTVAKNPALISLALYGSYSSGDYDEKSDMDFLVLSNIQIDRGPFLELQKKLEKNVQLTELTPAKWGKLKSKKDAFASSLANNHIVLWGARV